MARESTFLWYDLETTGRDTRRDRPLSFAAIRTDEELRALPGKAGEPVECFAELAEDVLIDPEAALVTGMTPPRLAGRGVPEVDFARRVAAVLGVPGTCAAGYNSIRFDDEFVRFLFWRNLLPVYARESARTGNSRWDLLDTVRAMHALRPDGLEWPRHDDGLPSFRLEDLARANGLEHDAHDALGDVRATLEIARRIRAAQPKLFAHGVSMRDRRVVSRWLEGGGAGGPEPVVLVHRRLAREFACASIVQCVGPVGVAKDLACVDLRHDPAVLLENDTDTLREWLFTRRDEAGPEVREVGLVAVKANQAPFVAPTGVLDDAAKARLELDPAAVSARGEFVRRHADELRARAAEVFERDYPPGDADEALYEGFVPRQDEDVCRRLHQSPPDGWRAFEQRLADPRLRELAFRMRARCHPDTLDDDERRRWLDHCRDRLTLGDGDGIAPLEGARERLRELVAAVGDREDAAAVLDEMDTWLEQRARALAAGAL